MADFKKLIRMLELRKQRQEEGLADTLAELDQARRASGSEDDRQMVVPGLSSPGKAK